MLSSHSQTNRSLQIYSQAFPEYAFFIKRFEAQEKISEPFEITLELVARDPKWAISLLSQVVTIALGARSEKPQYFHGLFCL